MLLLCFAVTKVVINTFSNPTRVSRRGCGVNIEQAQPVRFAAGRLCLPRMFNSLGAKRTEGARSPNFKHCLRQGLKFGAGDEARTRYLHLGKVALYQMSYARRPGIVFML